MIHHFFLMPTQKPHFILFNFSIFFPLFDKFFWKNSKLIHTQAKSRKKTRPTYSHTPKQRHTSHKFKMG
eukprot:NODE_3495_length_395_cov_172.182081_g2951_i0.p2 GENE.NODE_3495_length_395_cov_172.182081_g2951_i0~~NODE_3495_length_395_cov_172.182081_g2951_i0.p2  ORF type:complete len:69 (+),score=9.07 NODE_3495_length_395_cov_172.182081_g2951_i0:125-331(+)